MSDLPKRTLGRTGLEVTTLGYGAMELRGAPNGPNIPDEQAEKIKTVGEAIDYIEKELAKK